jgi:hypothetical protein
VGKLHIPNVDKDLLEEQRLGLVALLFEPFFPMLDPDQQAAVNGLVNMLDAWSDRELIETQLRQGPTIQTARDDYVNDDIEIDPDEDVNFSEGDDGTWVSAWVWVPWSEKEEGEPDGNDSP